MLYDKLFWDSLFIQRRRRTGETVSTDKWKKTRPHFNPILRVISFTKVIHIDQDFDSPIELSRRSNTQSQTKKAIRWKSNYFWFISFNLMSSPFAPHPNHSGERHRRCLCGCVVWSIANKIHSDWRSISAKCNLSVHRCGLCMTATGNSIGVCKSFTGTEEWQRGRPKRNET